MQEVTLTISGGPHVEPPDIAPPLPENPDLSGLRNLVEETVDEGQKQQPKATGIPACPAGVAAVLVLSKVGVISWLQMGNAGMLVSTKVGEPQWLAAAGQGVPVVQHDGANVDFFTWAPCTSADVGEGLLVDASGNPVFSS